jgi:tetratricopeptide (TPR) repeat protein
MKNYNIRFNYILITAIFIFLINVGQTYAQIDLNVLMNIKTIKKNKPKIKPTNPTNNKKITTTKRTPSKIKKVDAKTEIERLNNLGNDALDSSNYSEAEKIFQKIISSFPKDAKGYWGLGNINYYSGCFDDAIDLYNSAKNLDNKNPWLYYNLGLSYSAKGNYEAAVEYFNEVLRISPDAYNTRIKLANAYIEIEEYNIAEKLLKEAIALKPNLYDAKEELIDLYFQRKDYDKAEQINKPFITSPNLIERANAFRILGQIESKKNKTKEAIANYKNAIKNNPTNSGWLYFKIGDALMNDAFAEFQSRTIQSLEDYAKFGTKLNEIEDNFNKALQRNYSTPEVFYFLGIVHSLQLRFETAESEINKGLSIATQQYKATQQIYQKCPVNQEKECSTCDLASGKFFLGSNYFMRAMVLKAKEEEPQSKIYFENAIKTLNEVINYETPFDAAAYRMITFGYYFNEDYDKAISYGELALVNESKCNSCLSKDFAFFMALGEAYRENSRLVEAAKTLRKVLAISPDFPDAHLSLARIYEKQNLIPEAMDEYKKAISLNPDFDEGRYYLGLLLVKIGDEKGALEQYKALQAIDDDYAKWLLGQINKKFNSK